MGSVLGWMSPAVAKSLSCRQFRLLSAVEARVGGAGDAEAAAAVNPASLSQMAWGYSDRLWRKS